MNFRYQPYRVTVGFKNNGTLYGEETYEVHARDEDQAEAKALANATGSTYDDDRIPDRRLVILEIEELGHDCRAA